MSSLKEACGVAGIILKNPESVKEAAYLSYLCAIALQHRGQESAGIASVDEMHNLTIYRDMGLVSQVFDQSKLDTLEGHLSISHVRYSTTGESEVCNAQPLIMKSKAFHNLALAHNGNLVNANQLKEELLKENFELFTTSDSELIINLIGREINCNGDNWTFDAVIEVFKKSLDRACGSFSLAVSLGGEYLVGVRDPNGLRPLCLGAIKDGNNIKGYVIASESCALDVVGATYIREIAPGEIIVINKDLQINSGYLNNINPKFCLFELVYFARPDSDINDVQVYAYRENLGRLLAINSPIPPGADIVIGVPDSGTPAAIGYATQSGIPFANGLVKNRYIGRTFIQPTQSIRQLGIRLKLNPLPKIIGGKSVILIDDSIVRGNTPGQLVKLLKLAGAREVHLRISSPPIMWGCYYGIAMKDHELIARKMNGNINEICKHIGADSLSYLELDNLLEATHQNKSSFCTACFNGDYPVKIQDKDEYKKDDKKLILT
ncbi:MAG: amidophosphoribosyltransferase [Candidatus Caenarcaniphilales bacterium]|nr:amidophosphoribosyltransferase [Candidatus Caenarcaniphilales bacterium]